MENEWKKGQEVVVYNYGRPSCISTIERVTPGGKAVIRGDKYHKDGYQESHRYQSCYIVPLERWDFDAYASEERYKVARNDVRAFFGTCPSWLTTSQLERILDILEEPNAK